MTQEEFLQLVQDVTDAIQNKSKGPAQFDLATSLAGISSLPVLHESGGQFTLKRVLINLLKGADGREVEFQITATHIQWRYVGATWTNLIALSQLKGDKGNSVELQKTATHIQWREVGATTWTNLIPVADLIGATGASIELQVSATHIQWRVKGDTAWLDLIAIIDLKGAKGDTGNSAYDIAVENGFVGSEEEWIDSLKKPAEDAAEEANIAIVETKKATVDAVLATANAEHATEAALDTANNPTYIGSDNFVYEWNGDEYVKTDVYVKGESGAMVIADIADAVNHPDTDIFLVPAGEPTDLDNWIQNW